ncbi:hypothetical protein MTO96_049573 [Rhipicephalus appendiculatus]
MQPAKSNLAKTPGRSGLRVTFDKNLPDDDEERAKRGRPKPRHNRAVRRILRMLEEAEDKFNDYISSIKDSLKKQMLIQTLMFLTSRHGMAVVYFREEGPVDPVLAHLQEQNNPALVEVYMRQIREPVMRRNAKKVAIGLSLYFIFMAVLLYRNDKICFKVPDCPMPSCDDLEEWIVLNRSVTALIKPECRDKWFPWMPPGAWPITETPIPETTEKETTTKTTQDTTPEEKTTETTEMSTTEEMSTSEETTTPATVGNRFLFCVVSASLREDTFPPDGLCDVVSFKNVKLEPKTAALPVRFDVTIGMKRGFDIFMKEVSHGKYHKTKTGLCIDSEMKARFLRLSDMHFLKTYTDVNVTYLGVLQLSTVLKKYVDDQKYKIQYFVSILPSSNNPSEWVSVAEGVEAITNGSLLFIVETYEYSSGLGTPCFVGGYTLGPAKPLWKAIIENVEGSLKQATVQAWFAFSSISKHCWNDIPET